MGRNDDSNVHLTYSDCSNWTVDSAERANSFFNKCNVKHITYQLFLNQSNIMNSKLKLVHQSLEIGRSLPIPLTRGSVK